MPRLKLIIFLFLILTFFLQFLKIDLWDYDFWWHIATGKYIVSTGSLPEQDPFSYTTAIEENSNLFPERENFILKQYWLAQVIFYIIVEHIGLNGIIILRSALYAMTLFFVLWRLHRWSVSLPVSFIFTFILFMMFMSKLTGERPVLFTILFTAVTFFILEDFKDKKDKRIFLLSPLMLLWANLHGGFILGVVIIMVFMFGEGVKIILNKTGYTRREIILFYTAAIVALGFSFINPTGWDAFDIAFSSKYKPFTQNIQEYESLFTIYKEKYYSLNYWHASLAMIFPVVLIIRNRKIDLTHIILLSGLFIMGISTVRYEPYYGIIAAMVTGREVDSLIKELIKKRFSDHMHVKLINWITVATFFSLIIYMVSFPLFKSPGFSLARGFSVPERAVDFIEKNRIEGNVFNDYAYGGYIAWKLYPWKKTFVDSRALNLTVSTESFWIIKAVDSLYNTKPSPTRGPLWERLLNHYDINFVFLPLHDVHATVLPIIFTLSESDKWAPVYCDPISIIFVRNTAQNMGIIEKFKLSKENVFNTIIYQSAKIALANQVNPRSLKSLGDTFYKMGRLNDALIAYRYAMNRLPSPLVKEKIDQIESELKMEEKGTDFQ